MKSIILPSIVHSLTYQAVPYIILHEVMFTFRIDVVVPDNLTLALN